MNLVASTFPSNGFSLTNVQDEAMLVHRIKDKDHKALEVLYKRYHHKIYSLVYSIVQRQEETEDLLQDLFVKIWEKAHTYNEKKGSVYSWLATMSRNKAIDCIRSKRYRNAKLEETNDAILDSRVREDDKNPLEEMLMNEQVEYVRNALNRIPQHQREAISIAYLQGMTHDEISEMLDVPLGTVKFRIRQGKMKLERILQNPTA